MKRGALAHYHFTVFPDPCVLFFESLCHVFESGNMELFSELILALLNQFVKRFLSVQLRTLKNRNKNHGQLITEHLRRRFNY